ncbi:TPA: hypothetical protein RQL23_004436 [Vibrio vulnificus]|nr:hypothetical protein [Vibrio vulnificus]
MIFIYSLGWLILSLSASWLQWALLSGHLFFGAGNSESYLNQFSRKREVAAVGSIRTLNLGFLVLAAKFPSLIFKNYESFRFSAFWLLFVNQSRVNLVFSKT